MKIKSIGVPNALIDKNINNISFALNEILNNQDIFEKKYITTIHDNITYNIHLVSLYEKGIVLEINNIDYDRESSKIPNEERIITKAKLIIKDEEIIYIIDKIDKKNKDEYIDILKQNNTLKNNIIKSLGKEISINQLFKKEEEQNIIIKIFSDYQLSKKKQLYIKKISKAIEQIKAYLFDKDFITYIKYGIDNNILKAQKVEKIEKINIEKQQVISNEFNNCYIIKDNLSNKNKIFTEKEFNQKYKLDDNKEYKYILKDNNYVSLEVNKSYPLPKNIEGDYIIFNENINEISVINNEEYLNSYIEKINQKERR